MKKKLSVSLMCCDLMNVAHDIKILEEGGVDWFHLDVMDAHFVPNLTFGPDFINSLRKISHHQQFEPVSHRLCDTPY